MALPSTSHPPLQPQLPRHYSDTSAFAPRQPSRLGPGRLTHQSLFRHDSVSEDSLIARSRGTVSMPATPIATGTSHWHQTAQTPSPADNCRSQQPHSTSMQVYDSFNVSEAIQPRYTFDPVPHSTTTSGWYDAPQHHPDPASSSDCGHQMSTDEYSTPEEYQGPPRKKRAQVRIACTHCQKACKKCSNTRPCDRCVKYGLKDCLDSTRKPRKTGVKRGPYKRRSMSKFTDFDSPSSSADSYFATQPHQPPPHQLPSIPLQLPLADPYAHRPASPSHYPPGPRTAALEGAFASALHGARWEHGQRPDKTGQQVLYPPTPNAPFPTSLSGREDPFSRAVSPIHGAFDFGLQVGFKRDSVVNGPTLPMFPEDEYINDTPDALALPSIPPSDPSPNIVTNHDVPAAEPELPLNVFSDPFSQSANFTPQHYSISAPTSPRNKSNNLTWDDPDLRPPFARSSSTEPVIPAQHRLYQHLPQAFQAPMHLPHALQSPGIVALTKIRKPSLRTLMSYGGSQAGSRQVSPIQESPTLFDQPMSLDDDDAMMGLEGLPEAWTEGLSASHPNLMENDLTASGTDLDLTPFGDA